MQPYSIKCGDSVVIGSNNAQGTVALWSHCPSIFVHTRRLSHGKYTRCRFVSKLMKSEHATTTNSFRQVSISELHAGTHITRKNELLLAIQHQPYSHCRHGEMPTRTLPLLPLSDHRRLPPSSMEKNDHRVKETSHSKLIKSLFSPPPLTFGDEV